MNTQHNNTAAHNARLAVIADIARRLQRNADNDTVQLECYAVSEVSDALEYVSFNNPTAE